MYSLLVMKLTSRHRHKGTTMTVITEQDELTGKWMATCGKLWSRWHWSRTRAIQEVVHSHNENEERKA